MLPLLLLLLLFHLSWSYISHHVSCSSPILRCSKMGDTWEQQGKPNPNPVVYNMGGPLL
jgi:hypothetical protein